ncbi:MAG TPA: EAL domain-containing protein [Bacillota bacterium]|nr:EAL domain-containing protein [Bacillota bacterium]
MANQHENVLKSSNVDSYLLKRLKDINFALDQSTIVNVTNKDGVIISVNDKLCEISGYRREELIGKNHRIFNSSYHSKQFFKTLWQTITRGQIWQGEIRNLTKDGQYFWVDTTIVPFLDETNQPYQFISVRHDITKRKQMEEKLQHSERMHRLITENTSDLIAIIDSDTKFQYVSPSHETVLNVDLATIEASHLSDWIHEADRKKVNEQIDSLLKDKEHSINIDYRLLTNNDSSFYVNSTINAIYTDAQEIACLVLVTRDITESKKAEQTYAHFAMHDALTDLPNRRHFLQMLEREVALAKETNSPFALLFIDLDQFKYVNDRWGHQVGDSILAEFADRLKFTLRSFDIVARLGGDEFAVVLRNVDNQSQARRFVRQIFDAVKIPIDINGDEYTINCIVGIAFFPEHAKTADEMLSKADTALYAMKERGKGYLFYDPELEEQSLEQVLLQNELRKAIENNEFYIDYQPKVNLETGELIGLEALLRWQHPELGLISPGQFIPLAEESGLIVPIGEWVLREAVHQNKRWQMQGYPPVKISVNLSVRQLADEQFIHCLKEVLHNAQLNPNLLELEVTETMFVDVENAGELLQRIRALGVHISVDDFGTGYSTFNYIKKLPIDTLKIDRSFISDIDVNEESQAIASAIITLAKTLNINVIAEGIERNSQADFLKNNGCKQGQGFYFGKPISAQNVEKLWQESHS